MKFYILLERALPSSLQGFIKFCACEQFWWLCNTQHRRATQAGAFVENERSFASAEGQNVRDTYFIINYKLWWINSLVSDGLDLPTSKIPLFSPLAWYLSSWLSISVSHNCIAGSSAARHSEATWCIFLRSAEIYQIFELCYIIYSHIDIHLSIDYRSIYIEWLTIRLVKIL